MIIDLTKFLYNNLYKLPIEGEIEIPKSYIENTDIRDISKVKVDGYIFNNEENYELSINVSGVMILPCARTLKDVEYKFDIDIDASSDENDDNSFQIIQNRLDIFPIIWQNILVDVPLRVIHPDAKEESLSGDGWSFDVNDEKKETIDPRLEALSKYKE